MKVDRHGKAKILTQEEIQLLFREGFQTERDCALFGICLFSACRINEAVTLKIVDAYDTTGRVRPKLIIRKGNTKGKLATRTIPIIEDLRLILTNYKPNVEQEYLFPGRFSGHIDPESASRILRKALRRVGIEGVSTHSFRRTALTLMSNAGIPLRVIQEVSGHRDLNQLQKYLEVEDSQVLGAVTALSMLSPVGEEVRKMEYVDLNEKKEGEKANQSKVGE
jgi:integrase/recombinase XerD